MKELKGLKDFLEKVSQLTTSYEDIGVLIEMAYGENDESLVPEIESELTAFQQDMRRSVFRPCFPGNTIKTMQL